MLSILFDLFFYMIESLPTYEFSRSFIYMFWLLLFFLCLRTLIWPSKL